MKRNFSRFKWKWQTVMLLLFSATAMAQDSGQVKGTVVNEAGDLLSGVSVTVTQTGSTEKQTTMTGEKGLFAVSSLKTGSKYNFTFSHVGYQNNVIVNYLVSEGNNNSILVRMLNSDKNLDQVVVVGYGKSTVRKLTSSISKVNYDDAKSEFASFGQAIVGEMPGVRATESSGKPGGDTKIAIRGISTITAGTNPLIVLDGLPLPSGTSLGSLNGDDIKSIDVLKDAASASIYGSRGANGVIMITTKEGARSDKPTIEFKTNQGVQQVAKKIAFMDAYQVAKYQALGLNNAWVDHGGKASDPNSVRPLTYQIPDVIQPYLNNTPGLTNTDWQDVMFRKALTSDYSISVDQRTDKTKYYMSGSYLDQDGIIQNTNFKRMSFRTNLDTKLNNQLSFGLNFNPNFSSSNQVIEGGHSQDGVLLATYMSMPYYSPYNADGTLAESTQITNGASAGLRPVANPLALATQIQNNVKQYNFFGGMYLNYQIIPGLNFKTYAAGSYLSVIQRFFRPSYVASYNNAPATVALGRKRNDETLNYISENTLTYNHRFNKHSVEGLLGYSFQKEHLSTDNIIAEGFTNNDVKTLNAGTIVASTTRATGNFPLNTTGTFESQWVLISYFGRIKYDYDDKYLMTASIRRDGDSKFGKNNKFGWFPSVSLGWRVSKENFFDLPAISDLKVRASVGKTGNEAIPTYGAIPLTVPDNYVFGNTLTQGISPSTSPNANLSWESNRMIDFGLDVELLKIISVTGDYYNSKTSDLLLNVPVPASAGYTYSLRNYGAVENKGFEFTISSLIKFGAVSWRPGFNIYANHNKVVELGPGQDEISSVFLHLTQVGHPIGLFYGYNCIGVYQSAADLSKSAKYTGAAVGTYKFEDVNKDGVIDANDQKILGNPAPRYNFGFSSSFQYKNFDMSFLIQGSQGNKLFLNGSFTSMTPRTQGNIFADLNNNYFISEGNPNNGKYARPSYDDPGSSFFQNSSLKIKDASFIRMRSLSIGYNLSRTQLQKYGIAGSRIFFTATNLFTITKYPLYNPETDPQPNGNGVLESGLDWSGYPVARTFNLGLKLSF